MNTNDVFPTIPPRQAQRGDRLFYPGTSAPMCAATVSRVEPFGVWVDVVYVRPTAVGEREEIIGKPLSFVFLEATKSFVRPLPLSRRKGAHDAR